MGLEVSNVERNEDWEVPKEIEEFRGEMFLFCQWVESEKLFEEIDEDEKEEDEDKVLELLEAMNEDEQREEEELSVEFLEDEKEEDEQMALTSAWRRRKVLKIS